MTRILASILLLLTGIAASAQTVQRPVVKNSEGTEFWLCFQKNFREGGEGANRATDDPLSLQLFITSEEDAIVTIEVEGINYRQRLEVRAGTVREVRLPASAQVVPEEQPARLGVHIVSDAPITVYGLNHRYQTTDTFLGLPVSVLGTTYRAISYKKTHIDLLSQLAIVATEDSTQVTIVPNTTTTRLRPAGQSYTVQLRKGDVYQIMGKYDPLSDADLTGTLITSNRKISVFSGHGCANIPARVDACNHLVEQLPPVASWGKHFYVGKLKERSRYTLRVVANEDNTRVFEGTRLVALLNAGEVYENSNVRQSIQISADKPVLVAQYSQGFKNGDTVGDPMMILVSPTQQFLKEYRFATPVSGQWKHYVNVVVPTEAIDSLQLNGRRPDRKLFEPFGLSRYSIGQISIPFGTHTITGSTPFGLYSYGFGFGADQYDAYGNMAGQSFIALEDAPDTIPPMAEGRMQGEQLLMIIRDDRENDRGLRSVRIVQNEGLDAVIPVIEAGVLQMSFPIRTARTINSGRMVLQATDLAQNSAIYTVCYFYDPKAGGYAFEVQEGNIATCVEVPVLWEAGAFIIASENLHSANFSSTGNISAQGNFGDASGSGGYLGLMLRRKIDDNFALSARLSFETYGGVLTSPDSSTYLVRDRDNNIRVAQEGRTLELDGSFLSLSIAGEYSIHRYFYALAGLKHSFTLSNAIQYKREILSPADYVYQENGTREILLPEENLSSVNFFRLGVFAGVGASYPVTQRVSAFLEAVYTYHIGSIISDGDWNLQQYSAHAGVKVRL